MTPDETLSERVRRERFASDSTELYENVSSIHHRFAHVFACPAVVDAKRHRQHLLDRLLPDATVLDYGCFEGASIPLYLAGGPHRLVGIDISEKGIATARERFGDRAEFQVADAHALTAFDDGSFDLIVGAAILHHLDLDVAVGEIHRLLRPGGAALFTEPLATNPLGALWRRLTPQARTADEAPLSRRDLTALDEMFSSSDHWFSSITSTPIAVATSLLPMAPDNVLLRAAGAVDRRLQETPLRWGARTVYIHWVK